MKNLGALVILITTSIACFAFSDSIPSDTVSMMLPRSAAPNHVIYKNNIWMAFDRHGGVIEYDVSTKKLIPHDSGLGIKTVTDIAVFKGNLFITSKFEGILMYDSVGDRWKNCTPLGIFKDSNFFALEAAAGILVASGCAGFLYYTENGIHWKKVTTDFHSCLSTICFAYDSWWIGAHNSTMFKYDRLLKTKRVINNLPIRGRTRWGFTNIVDFQGNIYAINFAESIIVSKDSGITWQIVTRSKPWIKCDRFYPIGDSLYIHEAYSGLYLLDEKHQFNLVFTDLIPEPKENEHLSMIIEHNGIQIFCSNERIIVID
jgi:hypothetical protein